MVNNLEDHNDNIDIIPTEEEYDFTDSYFVNTPTFDQDYIERIATDLNIKKYIEKYKEAVGDIGHDSWDNHYDSMRVL